MLLLVVERLARPDLLVDEGFHPIPKIGFAFTQGEIHGASSIALRKRALDRTAFSVKRLCRRNRR
jgi:hypothetical protein